MSTSIALPSTSARSTILRRRHRSLLAFFPRGIWTANHLLDNLAAFRGSAEWQTAVTRHENPVAHLLTIIFVLLPLVLHTVWGVKRLFSTKPNVGRYPLYSNLKYVLQRLSAVGLFLFIGAHLWLAMLQPRFVKGHAETFADIAAHMRHHPPTLAVYILGTLGVSYHLANGIQSLAMGWGVVSSRAALKKLEILVIGIFAILTAMGWAAIFALYQAGGAFPPVVD